MHFTRLLLLICVWTGLVLLSASGRHSLEASLEYVRYVVKYRPRAPVLLITQDPQLARACAPW
jgi:hypothetical protein